MSDTKEKFLKEYEILCKKYKIIIDGCGCCGSPFIYSEKEMQDGNFEEELKENIEHLMESLV